ncbi:hypothetical protein L7F22_007410 [Adiantum nelumboides]|nr:hypothetical protein [Adiantum nelumboides]
MVQLPVLHASTISTPLCAGSNVARDEGGCSSQQIAAAWAWFEHSGATCITPPSAEGLRGTAHRRSAHQQPSRFKKEFLAALAVGQSDIKEENPGCTSASPAVLPLRRHSFHDKSHGNLTESCDNTILHGSFRSSSARVAGMSDQERHAYVDNLLNQMLHADDSNGDAIGSSLMDEFEQEAVWQQMLHRIAHADFAYAAKCNGTTESHMYAKTEHNTNLEADKLNLESLQQSSHDNGREEQNKFLTACGPNLKHSSQQSSDRAKAEHIMNSAAYGSNFEYDKLSPNDASSHRKLGSSDMHKRTSSYQDNDPHSRLPSKHFHQHRSSSPPDLLYHLLHFRNGKSARSPAFCSSISTADSIKNYRLLPPLASKPKAKQQARLWDSKSMELNCIDADHTQSNSVVRKHDNDKHKGLDNDHYHRHRHVHLHHHHHHHHHVLHHREEHAMILDHIMTKEGGKGIPMSPRKSRSKLHIDGSMQGTLLAKKKSHDYYERNEGPPHKGYGYLEKDEYLLHLPYVDYQRRSSFS